MIFRTRDAICLCLCVATHFIYRYRRKRLLPFPPGPPGWPIIGNALQLPLERMYAFYEDLGKRLGSKILYVEALGQPIVVINDLHMAIDLLEKRSALYSSRPRSVMLHEVMETDHFFGLKQYGDEWRNHRRIFQQHFSVKNLHREQETTLEFVRKFLLPSIYQGPQDLLEHVKGCIGAVSLSITYGLPVRRINDSFIHSVETSFANVAAAGSAGKYLANVIPILKYVPEWVPGATFKRDARELREELLRLMEVPFQEVLKSMEEGTASESFVAASIEGHMNRPDFEMHKVHIKEAATQIFGGAYETTVISVMTFALAMRIYPEIQRKAQQEIDSVVGPDRLPDFSDWEHLPYFSAVVKEVLRWNPPLPLALPHLTSTDDVYKNYYIPKGAIVMANTQRYNISAILHDEEIFPSPEDFKPERFVKDGVLVADILDPLFVGTFGYGRRICPGSHIARSALYITAASILSLFDILPALDAEGQPIDVKPEFTVDSLFSIPLPFECKVAPRKDKNVEGLLESCMGFDVL